MFAVTSSFILHQLCLLGGPNLYVQAHNPWTNKQKQNHLRNSVFFTTWMLFNVRDQTTLSPESDFFFLLRNIFLGTDAKNMLVLLLCCYKLKCVAFRTERAEINHLQASILSFY